MKLTARSKIWSACLLLIFTLNFALGLFAYLGSRSAADHAADHYEILLQLRRLRSSFLAYHDAALTAALTRSPEDLRLAASSRDRLIRALDATRPDLAPHPNVDRQLDSTIRDIRFLLTIDVDERTDPMGAGNDTAELLTPLYQSAYRRAVTTLDRLTDMASFLLEEQSLTMARLQERTLPTFVAFFALSFAGLLLGLAYFLRCVLAPLTMVSDVVRKVQSGEMSARCPEGRRDEIGEMCRTLNQMIAELDLRRRERIRFIGSVAHDLKNPLTAIRMNAELAERYRDRLSAGEMLTLFDRIGSQARKVERLTEDLKRTTEIARPEWVLRPGSVPFEKLLDDILESARSTFINRQIIQNARTVPDNHSGILWLDADRVAQAIGNLISNAVKYSPANEPVEVNSGFDNDHFYIEVIDRGPGIPDHKKAAIFNPYERLQDGRNLSEGSGLGLAITRDIVRAHGGKILVLDRPGGGAIFRVEIPSCAPSSSRALAG